jgi:inner membrane transporter RhtA
VRNRERPLDGRLDEAAAPPGPLDRVPAVWLVLGGIVSVQVGAAVAKGLFGTVPPTTMVWLRLATSAVLLLPLVRPRLRGHRPVAWRAAVLWGVTLAGMNWSFYQALARIPLGIAVTIEFLGPLVVAVLGSRRRLDLVWVVLAGVGVVILGWDTGGLDPVGIGFALLAGVGWAAYILLSARTGQLWPGLSGLAVASAVSALLLAGPAVVVGGSVLLDPRILLVGLAVGLLSAVIPFSLELVALRSMRPSLFGILMSLEPAAAALAAMILLREFLSLQQWLAMASVIVASVGASRTRHVAEPEPG